MLVDEQIKRLIELGKNEALTCDRCSLEVRLEKAETPLFGLPETTSSPPTSVQG